MATFKSIVDSVIYIIGNRQDLKAAATFAVNDAVKAVCGFAPTPSVVDVTEVDFKEADPSTDPVQYVDLPAPIQAVSAVSFYLGGLSTVEGSSWRTLSDGNPRLLLELSSATGPPTHWIQKKAELWLYPTLDQAYSVRILGVDHVDEEALDSLNNIVLEDSHVPGIRWLAVTMMKIILGEAEVAGSVRQLAAMMSTGEQSTKGKTQAHNEAGVQVVVGDY